MMHRSQKQEGVALVVALAVMAIIFLLVLGTFVTTQIEQWTTRNDAVATQAHDVAEAGLQKYKAALFQYYRWVEKQPPPTNNPSRTVCYNRLAAGIDWQRNGSVQSWVNNQIVIPNQDLVADGETVGNYDVTITKDPNNSNYFTVRSVGHSHGATSTVQATFWIQNSGVLEHAIFAGNGQSTRYLNGNVTVRGGVYVVGPQDQANYGDTVVNADGNFGMYNSYNLTDTQYSNHGVDLANFVNTSNQTASNLCATFRVQHGKVAVGGSSSFGTPTNKLLGVYISGGATDITSNGNYLNTCSNTKGICTDQGPSAFDIASPPKFPTFSATGNCGGSQTWGQCIDDKANSPGDGLQLSFTSSGAQAVTNFSGATPSNITTCLSQLTSSNLVLDSQTINCTYQTSDGRLAGFEYEGGSSPASFKVYGTVDLKGFDVTFNKPVRYTAQTYESGTQVVDNSSFVVSESSGGSGGNITTNSDMLPDTAVGPFPDHVLSFLAQNNFTEAAGSGAGNPAFVMAPVYAGNTYYSEKGNVLVGSVITDTYCTTSSGTCPAPGTGAGGNSQVVYVNTGNNKPAIMRELDKAGLPTFKVLSYENR